jgi:hypothetical protein
MCFGIDLEDELDRLVSIDFVKLCDEDMCVETDAEQGPDIASVDFSKPGPLLYNNQEKGYAGGGLGVKRLQQPKVMGQLCNVLKPAFLLSWKAASLLTS